MAPPLVRSLLALAAALAPAALAGAGADAGDPPAPRGAAADSALPPLPPLDRVSWARLRAGRTLSEAAGDRGDSGGAVRGLALCACSSEAAWAVLTDHARFPEFVPRVKAVEVVRRTAVGERAVQTIDVGISTVRYALDYAWDPATRRVEFHLVEELPHDVAAVKGAWQIWPLDGGKATLIEYRSEVEVGRMIPSFIRSYLSERGVKDTLEAVRKRAEGIGRGETR